MSSGTNHQKFENKCNKKVDHNEKTQLQNASSKKSALHIDKKMLIFKLHYFLYFGGLSVAVPFIPIYARNRIGLSNTALAVILLVQQVSFVITKPFIGYLADYFKKLRTIMCILIIMQTTCIFLILVVPAIDLNSSSVYSSCLSAVSNGNISTDCQIKVSNLSFDSNLNLNSSMHCIFIEGYEYQKCLSILTGNTSTLVVSLKNKSADDFRSYQFWLFAFLYTFGMICCNGLIVISDTACCDSVKEFGAEFGRQRLWGVVGSGLLSPLSGFLNDYSGDYLASWITLGVFSTLTILNIIKMDLIEPQFSQNILRDFCTVLKSREFLVFEVGLIFNGIGSAMAWYYLILFLNSIGASKLLCGLTQTVQCFLGSIPLMFFSENIINKLGHLNVLSLSLVMYAIRFMWYSYLQNPWLVLVAESLHGFTFGLLYANAASFGKDRAKVGTEATTQSVLFTTHEGLGTALGCVLGGLGLDYLGGHDTFFIASLFAMLSLVFYQILVLFVNRNNGTFNVTPQP